MWQLFLLQLYMRFHGYYQYFWELLFYYVGRILFVYYIEKDKIKNITINYYTGFGMQKYTKGTYYIRFFDKSGTNHVAYDGCHSHISKFEPTNFLENLPKRKSVVLLDNDKPVIVNLEVLDKYRSNMINFETSVKNLGKILELLGIQCTHVAVIEMMPYTRNVHHVNDIDIDYIYHG